jgi:hypothetical protein
MFIYDMLKNQGVRWKIRGKGRKLSIHLSAILTFLLSNVNTTAHGTTCT